jgi:glycosyltransferase involved in cell wall biosynthesis
MSGQPRLLFVVNQTEFFLSHRLPVALAAKRHGYDVHIATPTSPGVAVVQEASLTHHALAFSRQGMRPFAELATLRALFRLYRKLRPDIVHHVTIKPVIYGSTMARVTSVPAVVNAVSGLGYVFVSRGLKATLLRCAVRWAYRRALNHPNSRVIFQNNDDLELFTRDRLVRPQQGILVKGSGVDLKRFVPTKQRKEAPVVLFASRLLRDKGVCEFVDAARALQSEGVPARFVLVGDVDPGNPASLLTDTVKSWHQERVIEWWGQREDMPAVFAQAHIVCLPSYREGLPKVLIEAAACGRPIVATDVPGCREIVRHNNNGLLVPAKDGRALANALRRLIMDPALRERMGRRGREIAVQEFGLERVIAETLVVYRTLLAGREGGVLQGTGATPKERRSA